MEELINSKIDYSIVEENGEVKLLSNCKYVFYDALYDNKNERWVFAVQSRNAVPTNVDYIFLTKEFVVLEILSETKGVMPYFIKGVDDSIWVTLESTSTEKDGEIVLPLKNRERINKVVPKKSIGMDYFTYNNRTYGYFMDFFDKDKESQIALYEFDKNAIYKNRKMIKLEHITNGFPLCAEKYIFFAVQKYGNDSCIVDFYKIDEKMSTERICTTVIEFGGMLVGVTDAEFMLLVPSDDTVELIIVDYSGVIVTKQEVARLKSDMVNFNVLAASSDYSVGVIRTETINYVFLYKNKIVKLVEVEDLSIKPIDDKHFISSSLNGGKYWTIRSFDL